MRGARLRVALTQPPALSPTVGVRVGVERWRGTGGRGRTGSAVRRAYMRGGGGEGPHVSVRGFNTVNPEPMTLEGSKSKPIRWHIRETIILMVHYKFDICFDGI